VNSAIINDYAIIDLMLFFALLVVVFLLYTLIFIDVVIKFFSGWGVGFGEYRKRVSKKYQHLIRSWSFGDPKDRRHSWSKYFPPLASYISPDKATKPDRIFLASKMIIFLGMWIIAIIFLTIYLFGKQGYLTMKSVAPVQNIPNISTPTKIPLALPLSTMVPKIDNNCPNTEILSNVLATEQYNISEDYSPVYWKRRTGEYYILVPNSSSNSYLSSLSFENAVSFVETNVSLSLQKNGFKINTPNTKKIHDTGGYGEDNVYRFGFTKDKTVLTINIVSENSHDGDSANVNLIISCANLGDIDSEFYDRVMPILTSVRSTDITEDTIIDHIETNDEEYLFKLEQVADKYVEVGVGSYLGPGYVMGFIKTVDGWKKAWAGQEPPLCSNLKEIKLPSWVPCFNN